MMETRGRRGTGDSTKRSSIKRNASSGSQKVGPVLCPGPPRRSLSTVTAGVTPDQGSRRLRPRNRGRGAQRLHVSSPQTSALLLLGSMNEDGGSASLCGHGSSPQQAGSPLHPSSFTEQQEAGADVLWRSFMCSPEPAWSCCRPETFQRRSRDSEFVAKPRFRRTPKLWPMGAQQSRSHVSGRANLLQLQQRGWRSAAQAPLLRRRNPPPSWLCSSRERTYAADGRGAERGLEAEPEPERRRK